MKYKLFLLNIILLASCSAQENNLRGEKLISNKILKDFSFGEDKIYFRKTYEIISNEMLSDSQILENVETYFVLEKSPPILIIRYRNRVEKRYKLRKNK